MDGRVIAVRILLMKLLNPEAVSPFLNLAVRPIGGNTGKGFVKYIDF